ncbi:MAG: hypothetical protein QG656_964 [Candidatus Hydrogenedentes bacterium]|nr:hypothetical protein [Candidatus Hydrogenedentota bacterium]
MQQVSRFNLDTHVQRDLDKLQLVTDRERALNALDVAKKWKAKRGKETLRAVLETLRAMMGSRERCMYCLDSHGTDIDHFWPKMSYPEKMFLWENLLLCCSECGRLKSDLFPMSADSQPLLVDPTAENPWLYLDFDPGTGNVVPRFDPNSNEWLPKGIKTVEILHLDRREALAAGYRKTYRRLARRVEQFLASSSPNANELMTALHDEDEHGLLWWCFCGSGQNEPPFSELRTQHPRVWEFCATDATQTMTSY